MTSTQKTATVLHSLVNGSLPVARAAMTRSEYEQAYIEADKLHRDQHVAKLDTHNKPVIVHHPAKWTRRVR